MVYQQVDICIIDMIALIFRFLYLFQEVLAMM